MYIVICYQIYVPLGLQMLSVRVLIPNTSTLYKIKSLVISVKYFLSFHSAITDSIYRAVTSKGILIFQVYLDISWNSRTSNGKKLNQILLKSTTILFGLLRSWQLKLFVLGQRVVEHRLESITSIHLYFKSLYMDYKEFLFRKKKLFG